MAKVNVIPNKDFQKVLTERRKNSQRGRKQEKQTNGQNSKKKRDNLGQSR